MNRNKSAIDEINESMKDFSNDINKILSSTQLNTNNLIRDNQVRFTAQMSCDICSKVFDYKNIEELQYEQHDPSKRADLLNTIAGFEPNGKKINELVKKFHLPETTENEKLEIQKQVKQEQQGYSRLFFVCLDCANRLQKKIKDLVVADIKEVVSGSAPLTEIFGISLEERKMLTASLTDKEGEHKNE